MARLNLNLSKVYIVGNHMSRLTYFGLKAFLCLFQKEIQEIGARNSNITSQLFTTKEQGTDPALKCKSHARIQRRAGG